MGDLPHSPNACARLELSVRASELRNADMLSKSDPVCVLDLRSGNGAWARVGQTETVHNDNSPTWRTPFVFDYYFEEPQQLRFTLHDVDNGKLGAQLGSVQVALGSLMGSRGLSLKAPLTGQGSRPGATLTVLAEQLATSAQHLTLVLKGQGLTNRAGMFGTSSPFFRLSKLSESGALVQVAESGAVKSSLDPAWSPLKVSLQKLCNADVSRPLRLEVFGMAANGKHAPIGVCDLNAQALMTGGTRLTLKDPSPGVVKPAGTITVAGVTVEQQLTFVDWLKSGLEMRLVAGIDFTASNGDPQDPRSLHFRGGPPFSNPYAIALSAVGAVMEPYDTDKKIPAYGYGAALPPNNVVSHCFALNGNAGDPDCDGIQGVLSAYDHALNMVKLSGPTCFAPLIASAATAAEAAVAANHLAYFVLLIITDGEIMDMQATVDALVRASRAPLSLLIVGVGDAQFDNMKLLDADGGLLRASSGAVAARDLVQFVRMRDYTGLASGARLASDVLAELPGQVVQHFALRGLLPPGLAR